MSSADIQSNVAPTVADSSRFSNTGTALALDSYEEYLKRIIKLGKEKANESALITINEVRKKFKLETDPLKPVLFSNFFDFLHFR